MPETTGHRVHRFTTERRPVGGSRGSALPEGVLELLSSNGSVVCVAFKCPCGCGSLARLWTNHSKGKDAIATWVLTFNAKHEVTLSPAIKSDEGCGAHFRIINNNVAFEDKP